MNAIVGRGVPIRYTQLPAIEAPNEPTVSWPLSCDPNEKADRRYCTGGAGNSVKAFSPCPCLAPFAWNFPARFITSSPAVMHTKPSQAISLATRKWNWILYSAFYKVEITGSLHADFWVDRHERNRYRYCRAWVLRNFPVVAFTRVLVPEAISPTIFQ